MKELIIKQNVLGQEVQINISLDKNNFINVNEKFKTPFSDNAFKFITENFYTIISTEEIVYNKNQLGEVLCYGLTGGSAHRFYFIYDGMRYCFHFGISKNGEILIYNESHVYSNIVSRFETLLDDLKCCSDKDYYSYFIQRLEEI